MKKVFGAATAAAVAVALTLVAGIAPAHAEQPLDLMDNWTFMWDDQVEQFACANVVFIGARGSGEPQYSDEGYGKKIIDVRNGLRETLSPTVRVRQVAIGFPALDTKFITSDPQGYYLSMLDGAQRIAQVMADSLNRCPDEKIVLAGYSQGAGAAHAALREWDYPSKISSVILVANPGRDEAMRMGTPYGAPKRASGLTGVFGLQMGTIPQAIRDQTIEYCKSYDPVCDLGARLESSVNPVGIGLRIARDMAIHSSYSSASMLQAGDIAAYKLSKKTPPTPVVTGDGYVGSTMTANTSSWNKGGGAMTYQWYRAGNPITGATARTYKLTWEDAVRHISVRVNAPNAPYAIDTGYSAPIWPRNPLPVIYGTPAVGQTLTAKIGTWSNGDMYAIYEWICRREEGPRDRETISSGTAKSLKLTAAQAGCKISVALRVGPSNYEWEMYRESSRTPAVIG